MLSFNLQIFFSRDILPEGTFPDDVQYITWSPKGNALVNFYVNLIKVNIMKSLETIDSLNDERV